MTWSQPQGYRLAGTVTLPLMSWALETYAFPTWRAEAVRAVAMVADELLAGGDDRDSVLRRLSYHQVGEEDLTLSRAQDAGVLLRAAEFLDLAHGVMHRPSAVPLPPALDLRCTAQFMDDPGDTESRYLYVLLGTESTAMEAMFASFGDVEPYPVPWPLEGEQESDADRERSAVWQRVLSRYKGFLPPSIVAPELQLAFDLVESIGSEQDDELAGQGKVTVSEVVAELALRRGGADVDELREALLAPIGD